jgi:hypothetical protein
MNDINVEDAFMRITKDVLKRIESGDADAGKKLPPVKIGSSTIAAKSLSSAPPPKKSFC